MSFPGWPIFRWWQKLPRFRHPKFTCNLLVEEYAPQREFAARHAVRQLKLEDRGLSRSCEPLLPDEAAAAGRPGLCRPPGTETAADAGNLRFRLAG